MIQFRNCTRTLGVVLLLQIAAVGGLAQEQRRGMDGMGGPQQQDMRTIHALFDDHTKISRSVTKIENGVTTITESDDPKVQGLLAEHVWAMQRRLTKHEPIRQWDPLFAELFKNADKIKMEVSRTPKGMKVVETSTDPYVVKLIQAHAAGVSEFAAIGMSIMHKQHDLPDETPRSEGSFVGKGDGISTCPVTGEPVNKDFFFGFYGRTVYFCCQSCVDAAKRDPARYIRP